MTGAVLILGGYGNFGKRIAAALVASGVPVWIAGRDASKARALAHSLGVLATAAPMDIQADLPAQLASLRPAVVVNTCGPFQQADYTVAQCCIAQRIHYIDLADGRDFVNGIAALSDAASRANVAVISGVSTVPALSSAVIEHYRPRFSSIDRLLFGISPGQKAERGLATTQGILSYVGKPLKPFAGHAKPYGWQDVYRQDYPVLGKRWMANCDIPDLDLLPLRYGIKDIRFSAGLELSALHMGLWALGWLVRFGLPIPLTRLAGSLWRCANWFDRFGSANGGMHMMMSGRDIEGNALTLQWFIIAREGYGPYIPTVPAIILARRLASGGDVPRGAGACVAMVSLAEYLAELQNYPIEVVERVSV